MFREQCNTYLLVDSCMSEATSARRTPITFNVSGGNDRPLSSGESYEIIDVFSSCACAPLSITPLVGRPAVSKIFHRVGFPAFSISSASCGRGQRATCSFFWISNCFFACSLGCAVCWHYQTQLKFKTSSSQFATPADWVASLPGTWGSEVLKTLEVRKSKHRGHDTACPWSSGGW